MKCKYQDVALMTYNSVSIFTPSPVLTHKICALDKPGKSQLAGFCIHQLRHLTALDYSDYVHRKKCQEEESTLLGSPPICLRILIGRVSRTLTGTTSRVCLLTKISEPIFM